MERVVGGQSFVYGSSSSSRRGITLLWFLILSLQITWAVSERNTQIILGDVTKVWNKTLLKDTDHCKAFHEANVSSYFYYWPEGNFEYCCQGFYSEENLKDYRYTMYGISLGTAAYYDLGLIDICLSYYWNGWHLYERYLESPVYYTVCEYSDVIHLFTDRFWRLVVGKYGLLATALPLIGSLQLFVFLAITLEVVYWRYWHSKAMEKTDMSFKKLKKITKYWLDVSWKNACMDWVHLCLLSIIGNGLVEAVGRTDPYDWQAKTFHRYSRVYLALSFLLWTSSFLHQLTQWIAVDKKISKKIKKIISMLSDGAAAEEGKAGDAIRVQIDHNDRIISKTTHSANRSSADPAVVAAKLRKLMKSDTKKDPVAELRKLLQLGPDWKWQPIAAQTAILFCLWAYLTYPSSDGLSATLLGFLVQAASPWSGLYACRVAFVTLPFLIKKLSDVKRIRHLLRSRKSKECARRILPGWIHKALNLEYGRVLCCLGCLAPRAEKKPRLGAPDSSESSSGSDIETY